MSTEAYFVDTNVLVYAALKDDVRHLACRSLLKDRTDALLYLAPQILAEFYSTITSAKRVTAPFTPGEAIDFIETLLSYTHIILRPISLDVSTRWLDLLKQNETRGARVFDVQIAATMLTHGISKLITYNGTDFKTVSGLELIEPEMLARSR